MYSAWGVKQCDKLYAATPFTEIIYFSSQVPWDKTSMLQWVATQATQVLTVNFPPRMI
jgi:hypothetical protein